MAPIGSSFDDYCDWIDNVANKFKPSVKRIWLNTDSDATAFLVKYFEVQERYRGTKRDVHAYLKIADCTRNIHLEFDFDDEKSRNARLKKLDKMINAMQVLREEIENAVLNSEE